jgi:hypothetical protein
VTTPPDELLAEVAEVALRYGWSLDAVLDLEHRDRRLFLTHARALAQSPAIAQQDALTYAAPELAYA